MTDIAASDDRGARLQSDAAEIHVPEPDADREAMLVKVGIALPILGLILIGIAWFQASGSKYVADQIPMLISGGVLGLGLILLGAAIWIRYTIARLMRVWLARDLIERQRQTDRIVEALGGRSD
jgi:hypothetical protein